MTKIKALSMDIVYDSEREAYTLKIKGKSSMPADDFVFITQALSDTIETNGYTTMGEYFEKEVSNG